MCVVLLCKRRLLCCCMSALLASVGLSVGLISRERAGERVSASDSNYRSVMSASGWRLRAALSMTATVGRGHERRGGGCLT